MENLPIWLVASILLVLHLLSAFFSAAETALTAASRARMHQLAKGGNRRAKIVNRLRSNSEQLISAILLGNNLLNITATALLTSFMTFLFGETGVVYATVVMTVTVLVFCEVMPKSYAINAADKAALNLAPLVQAWLWISYPITKAVDAVSTLLLRLLGGESNDNIGKQVSDEELRGAIDLAAESDKDDREEHDMLHSILDLAQVSVVKVMTHRRTVRMFNINTPARELVEDILLTPYSRVPLWENDPGNIIGILHVRALVRALKDGGNVDNLDIRLLISPPWFIPESANLLAQLQEFRRRREHFALVVDEYGVLLGIVTLEDILEEIVGQIDDEHDVPVAGVRHLADGHYIIPGTVPIRELNREYDWDLPEDPATTVAGLVMHEARTIPDAGQIFRFYGFQFEILRRQRNQITLLKVVPPPKRRLEEETGEEEDSS